ncbi:MAG: insulinase family protein [Sandaracinaceae bacterium]|nr:insulinase family protein [Sandaracinaceae bacterium]
MSAAARTPGPRFHTARGVPVFVEPSHELPIVDVEILLRQGAVTDDEATLGLSRLTAQMLRKGTRALRSEEVDDAIDSMGASLSIGVGHGWARLNGSVIQRNLDRFLELMGSLVTRPALRTSDVARLRRETEAELIALRDHDRGLAHRAFRRQLFGAHPYGRPIQGTLGTIKAFRREDVARKHAQLFTTGNVIVGVAGAVQEDKLRPAIDAMLRGLPEGPPPAVRLRAPSMKRGRRILVIDKPERSQTQVFLGTLAVRAGEPDYHALLVANTAFGGSFTSRLMQEIRVKRGWSYGTGSKVGADRQREAWTVWSHPAAEQLVDCLRLELELIDAWVERGLNKAELQRAKRYLVKSHAFDLDTAAKRLEPQLDTELYGLSPDWHPGFVARVREVTGPAAAAAVRKHLPVDDLAITIVATATDALVRALSDLPGIDRVDTVPFDRV